MQADNFQKTGCFNSLCPGFVQIDKEHAFGEVLKPPSQIGTSEKHYITPKAKQVNLITFSEKLYLLI